MIAIVLLGTALAADPFALPESDDPSTRTTDWNKVYPRSINGAHTAQVWAAAGIATWAAGFGLGYANLQGDGYGEFKHSTAVLLVGGGGAAMVIGSSAVAGTS